MCKVLSVVPTLALAETMLATAPGLTSPHLYVAGEGSVGNVDNGHDLSGHQGTYSA